MTLWIARFGVILLTYLFLIILIFALLADSRAAGLGQQAVKAVPAPPEPVAPMPQPALKPATHIAAPTTSASQLLVSSGTVPTTGREYPLYGALEIGRDGACGISIPNRFVSTHHARIYSQAGVWIIEDLGSTNGTLLNDQPLIGAHPLSPGDRLTIGDTEFDVK